MVNTKMTLQALEETVAEFWDYLVTKAASKSSQPIDDLVFEFLLTQNDSDERAAIETGYNVQDACSRYSHQPYIEVFTNVITGAVDVSVINHWVTCQVALMEALSPTKVCIIMMATSLSVKITVKIVSHVYSAVCNMWNHSLNLE